MVVTIDVIGMDRLRSSFRNYSIKIPKFARRGTWLFANHLAEVLRAEAPRGVTGYLKSKRGTHVKGTKKSNNWQIVMPYYTTELEKGTPSGTWISHKMKTELWAKQRLGRSFGFFRNYVFRRGTEGHPFTRRVIMRTLRELDGTLNRNVRRGIKLSKR